MSREAADLVPGPVGDFDDVVAREPCSIERCGRCGRVTHAHRLDLTDGTPAVVYLGCGHWHEPAAEAASELPASNLGASPGAEPAKS